MPANEKPLSRQVAGGLFWVACGKGAQALLQFAVVIILARLISPADFGLIAAALIVIGFSDILTELGFEAAIVQREKLEKQHLTTAFTASLVFASTAALLLFLFAPAISSFFNSEQLQPVLRTMVWLFPIRALATVGEALAQREMRFRWLAMRDTLVFGVGYFGVGVGLALLGFGVWSLIAANLGAAILKTTLILRAYPPPGLWASRAAFRELFYFGGGHTLARLSNYLALQGDNLVVARCLDLFSLGIYGRAYQLMGVPATVFGQILDRVLFPSLAKLQNQTQRLAEAYLQGVRLIALVMLPASFVGIMIAPEIVALLLGKAWAQVTLPFRILLLGLLMRTSYKLSDSLARATGAVYRRAWRQAIYAGAVIGGAWVGHFWGVAGVAAGVLVAVAANFFLMAGLSLKIVGRSPRDFFEAHIPAVKLGFCVAAIALPPVLLMRKLNAPPVLILATVGLTLMAAAAVVVRFAPRFIFDAMPDEFEKVLRKLWPTKDGRKPSLDTLKSTG